MASLQSLKLLLDHTQKQADDAASNLGKLNHKQQQAEQILHMLVQYRADYQTQFMTSANEGVSPTEWQNYRIFVEKLNTAIKEQQKNVALTKQRATEGKNAFQIQRKKMKSYDTLLQRAQKQQKAQEYQQEQRMLDEHATHKFFQRPTSGYF